MLIYFAAALQPLDMCDYEYFAVVITSIIYLCIVDILGFHTIIRCHGYMIYFLSNGCMQYV
jgi:hypothetical protein